MVVTDVGLAYVMKESFPYVKIDIIMPNNTSLMKD